MSASRPAALEPFCGAEGRQGNHTVKTPVKVKDPHLGGGVLQVGGKDPAPHGRGEDQGIPRLRDQLAGRPGSPGLQPARK